jgi:hypothetical protein
MQRVERSLDDVAWGVLAEKGQLAFNVCALARMMWQTMIRNKGGDL